MAKKNNTVKNNAVTPNTQPDTQPKTQQPTESHDVNLVQVQVRTKSTVTKRIRGGFVFTREWITIKPTRDQYAALHHDKMLEVRDISHE